MKNTKGTLFTLAFSSLGMLNACNAIADTNSDIQQKAGISTQAKEATAKKKNVPSFSINPEGNTIATRFVNNDSNWERPYNNEYARWLLNLELYPDGHTVLYYNKTKKQTYEKINVGVLKFDLVGAFSKGVEKPADLQQCADACIRIWAEYLWEHKEYEQIHFNNGPGFTIYYKKWADGYRVHFDKKWNASWSKDAAPDYSYTNFRKYLSFVFSYCGTASLAKELRTVKTTDIQPGDILIWGGSPGHAVTVMDVQKNRQTGKIRVMLSQSYMPAQEIEILANKDDNYSPWFLIDEESTPWIYTPQWDFNLTDGAKFVRWSGR